MNLLLETMLQDIPCTVIEKQAPHTIYQVWFNKHFFTIVPELFEQGRFELGLWEGGLEVLRYLEPSELVDTIIEVGMA